MNTCKPNCIFCNECQLEVLKFTKNFYVKIGKNIITPGHIMIIPKCHYDIMGEINNKEIVEEFLQLKEDVIEKVAEIFAKPFVCEYGLKSQSVFHAHTHFIPRDGDGYEGANFLDDSVLPTLKKFKIPYREIKQFSDLQNLYKEQGDYIYFEHDDKAIAVEYAKIDYPWNDEGDTLGLNRWLGYRGYFQSRFGLKNRIGWGHMLEKDKKRDQINAEKTQKLLRF